MLTLQHISSNCNPMPNSLCFLDSNTIAFCFRDQVGLYQLDTNKIILNINLNISSSVKIKQKDEIKQKTIATNRANCLCCLQGNIIIVGYDDGSLAAYARETENIHEWIIYQINKQDSAITFIQREGNTLITNNINSETTFYEIANIKQYKQGQTFLKQFDTLKFPLNKILQSIIQVDHNGTKILFMGGIDQKIHCYTRQSANSPLTYRFFLSGHQNSLTKLTATKIEKDFLIASASKDGYIRLWRLTQDKQVIKFHKSVKQLDSFYCFLDAVLISHESSVTSLKWVKFQNKQLQLVSSSLDCTICVWGVQKEGGAWGVDTRMGQFLGNKNAYFNVTCDQKHKYLVAVNYIGSALIWQYNKQNSKFALRSSFNGHSNLVKDLDWDHSGNFLVSISKDQTTRILARSNMDSLYHEISRAQVHGYDINSVSLIKVNNGLIDLIACGADEKVIRILQPPASFANYLNAFTKANLKLYFPTPEDEKKYLKSKPQSQILQYETYAQGGTQVLGLMTKVQHIQREKINSYYDDEEQAGEQPQQQQQIQDANSKQTRTNYKIAPHDDYLLKHTLWPEMNKLYGHPHQMSALAKNNERKLLASACDGKNKISCNVIIWSTQDWKIKKIIQYHSYTAYGIEWSPCGKYLATVSKDRKLGVFGYDFQNIMGGQVHARAILCAAWSANSELLATGSRDKTIKIHNIIAKQTSIISHTLNSQISALSFCTGNIVAAGCHDGSVYLLIIDLNNKKIQQIFRVKDIHGHTKPVTKLRYNDNKEVLATCGQDHSVRVFKFSKNHLQIQKN